MRVIKLTHGEGNGVDKACLMSASNMLIGRGADGDINSCVCPVLRAFIIPTNDAIPEHLLGELYGPLLWEILGTRTDDPVIEQQRAFAFADWAVREIAPLALDAAGLPGEASRLRGLAEIVTVEAAAAARAAANAAAARAAHEANAAAHANAANAADYAARAADDAHDAAATSAARTAAYAAHEANDAHDAGDTIWRKCPEIIRRVASIGDKRPVECVLTCDELAEALG